MVMAKAGSGSLLVKREPAAERTREKPERGLVVKEMRASLRHERTDRGRPRQAELDMRTERTRQGIRKRNGIKSRVRLSPERKAIRAERRAKRRGGDV